jgi:hypothetical protein
MQRVYRGDTEPGDIPASSAPLKPEYAAVRAYLMQETEKLTDLADLYMAKAKRRSDEADPPVPRFTTRSSISRGSGGDVRAIS